MKSMNASAPSFVQSAALSSPPSIPKTLSPCALAYWIALIKDIVSGNAIEVTLCIDLQVA